MRTLTAIMTILILIMGCTKSHIILQSFEPNQITHINNLKKFETVNQINNSVFYLQQGDVIPLKISLDTQWFTLKQSQLDLIAQQKLYFRIVLPKDMSDEKLQQLQALDEAGLARLNENEKKELFDGLMLFASRNANSWAPIGDPKALKEVLGIGNGSVSFGAAFNEDKGLWTNLVIKVTQKL